ncbi:MAG: MotA/TolQ/ExbB proton channel family protein [Prevotellaceae bacterium]|nr:MotA/TolQ/ExbB proton channel family protein [Prevotellaceae bacterium]
MLLQVPVAIADTLSETFVEPAVQTAQTVEMNLWEMTLAGGWLMLPLALLLLIGVYIFIERFLSLRNVLQEDPMLLVQVKDYLAEGKKESALALCAKSHTPEARMIEKGISRIGRPASVVQTAIENVANFEISKLNKGLPWLATAAGGAPMIGFLGTVIGMVQAFFDMSNAGDTVTLTILSSGVYTAMVTTVAGLIVGVLCFFAYNYLTAKISTVTDKLEVAVSDIMEMLEIN